MKDQKTMFELSYSLDLPQSKQKQIEHTYQRKIMHIIRKGIPIHKNESKSLQAEYLKLYRQIKLAHGLTKNHQRQTPNQKFMKQQRTRRVVTQANVNKLLIKQINSQMQSYCHKINPLKKSMTQPSQMSSIHEQNSYVCFMEGIDIRQKVVCNNFSPVQPNLKQSRKLRPIVNYLPKGIQPEQLNIEKMKINLKCKEILDKQSKVIIKTQSILKYDNEKKDTTKDSNSINPENEVIPLITRLESKRDEEHQIIQKLKAEQSKQTANSKQIIKKKSIRMANSISKYQKSSKIPNRKFKVPFETYYYRDLIWKINFSNEMIIQTPIQYEHRLRVFIGKGNNGGLIRGLIKRRIWFAITDKIQQANFVWTQTKYLPYYKLQNIKEKQVEQQQSSSKQSAKDKLLESGILTQKQHLFFKNYFNQNITGEQRADERILSRNRYFMRMANKNKEKSLPQSNQLKNIKITTFLEAVSQIKQQKMHNHLINNYVIGNKKALLKTMSLYYKRMDDYVFNYLPLTFHIQNGLEDPSYFKFLKHYHQRGKQIKQTQEQNVWIVKPGQFSNRGNGIKVCKTLDDIKSILKSKQKHYDGSQKTFIVQSYIEKPLLYNKRKFDLRHYMLMTCINGIVKGYWYRQGYVRTSSSQFSLTTKQGSVHLTNDAVQKMLPQYGKYQKGNKISYDELHNYLSRLYGYKNFKFKDILLPKMKKITTDIVEACAGSIDPQLHTNNFQIFGMDFMIDAQFNLWLIQVNTNPCLELSCPLLGSIIPKMVENALELTLDAAYPPPMRYTPKGVQYLKKLQEQNKFDLIYDSRIDEIFKQSEQAIDAKLLNEQEETYEDEGEEWNQDN